MLVHIVHKDGSYDFVSTSGLASLIETREILRFERSNGWVNINSPHVRNSNRPKNYTGPEKRSLYNKGPDRRQN